MFRYVSSAPVVPLVAAAGLSACAPAAVNIASDHVSEQDLAAIIKFTAERNSRGDISTIITVYNKPFDTFIKRRAGGKQDYNIANDRTLVQDIMGYLEKNGFNSPHAEYHAYSITTPYGTGNYTSGSPSPFHYNAAKNKKVGPHADSYGIEANVVTHSPQVSNKCSVLRISDTHSGEEWFRGFMNMDNDSRSITLSGDFGDDFSRFALYHEIAHCMGGGEQEADMAAAKLMLKESKNVKQTLAFLELIKAIRVTDAITYTDIDISYVGTFLAVAKVVQQFKSQGRISQSREQIWTEALLRKDLGAGKVKEINEIMDNLSLHALNKNFKITASYIHEQMPKLPTPEHKRIAKIIAESTETMGMVIGARSPYQVRPAP